jgi:hypothetical protein
LAAGCPQQLTHAGVAENDDPVAVPDGVDDELADHRFLAFTSEERRTSSIRPGAAPGVSAP